MRSKGTFHLSHRGSLLVLATMSVLAGWGASSYAKDPSPDPFTKGARDIYLYGSTATGDTKGEISSLHLGYGRFLKDRFALKLEGFVGATKSNRDDLIGGDDGYAGGFDIMLHQQAFMRRRFSLYLDAGGGFQYADDDFPSDSAYNFRLLIGCGGTLNFTPRVRLMGGVRWLHFSNSHTTEHNNGLDAPQVYLGLMRSL